MSNVLKKSRQQIIFIFLTVVISAVISISYYHLWGTDLRVPLSGYRGDSIGVLLELNNYVRGGSIHDAVVYGAPYLNEFAPGYGDSSVPMPLLKFLSTITGSIEMAVNLHAVLNCVLMALSTFWVCTQLSISRFSSMIAGISYANLAFFVLSCNTLLLIYSACFYIPLFCLILIELMRKTGKRKETSTAQIVFILAVMLYMGMNSAYYAFLAMILLAFAGMYVLFAKKSVEGVLIVVACYIAIILGIATYTLPNILHNMGYTQLVLKLGYLFTIILLAASIVLLAAFVLLIKKLRSFLTIRTVYFSIGGMIVFAAVIFFILKRYTDYIGIYGGRTYYDVELGALRITNIVLPSINNVMKSINAALDSLVEAQNADFTVLGILVGIGFLYSVMHVFQYNEKREGRQELLRICGLMNCFTIVLAIKGGLSSVIAMFVTTGIRNYSRICIFLAAFSLIAFCILCDQLIEVIAAIKREKIKWIAYAAASIGLVFGLVISIPTSHVYQSVFGFTGYEQRKAEYDEWHRYMSDIETQASDGGMILELPFSMNGNYRGMLMDEGRAYELAIPAILSKTTRWSYGGGANSAKWKRVMRGIEDTEEFLLAVGAYNFEGIYVDTLMYHNDSYAALLQELEQYLGEPLICNENRRFFFSMAGYNKELHEKYTDGELENIRKQIEQQF